MFPQNHVAKCLTPTAIRFGHGSFGYCHDLYVSEGLTPRLEKGACNLDSKTGSVQIIWDIVLLSSKSSLRVGEPSLKQGV